ncbi:MAG: hypothetical protein A2315_10870 [Ignavibacteria bacterium RIFOXYB2_FULL_35_12]|nr:MAG: hypothetical protein A2058_03410 [Ignavibacteria bacterium GWA2_36_19]OGU61488.1 MAG: hypothetical protein A2X60_02095 [Ignavibacteria bacterium GWF2_35_20]OGU78550.1 MAG: hypothetical protein A2254_05985 [Ignavibacteria bacterium RIFOXYA2_FULL_35_9]OGU85520.1 MAG: hypothetical protein A3K31_05165 [Ignavibacteria bacterium RIFOXYA12_FULL_35_25]OGU90289.1 MAG: hypothetical protein A2492_10015 [Ignavibacteria bacterium RIFOXYC12_FULL_35_11]OGU96725.1 MAG: hypothetical protein A2347_05055
MQARISLSGNNIYWRNFKWGTIFPSESTFQLVPRTSKNIFKLFGDGLGINRDALDLLSELKITYIEGTLNGKPFKVRVDKWIRKGIPSPYTSEKVDPQVVLKLKDIFSDDDSGDNQPSLFGNA